MTTLIRIIELEYDHIEIHHNHYLHNKPYLVRVFNYNNHEPKELRLNQKELDNLYNILKKEKLL